jgi:hypothetical protein
MANPTNIFEGFSLSHVAVLDGVTTAEDAAQTVGSDVYGVRNASLTPDTGQFDNEGDDFVLSSWYWLNFANLEVQAGYLSLAVMVAITGSVLSSSGSTSTIKYGVDLWHEDMFNVATKPVLVRVPSKDSLGNVRRLDFVLYKVQFGPITFGGPAYKAGLEVNYTGRALASLTNETGAAFADAKKRIGRIISGPVI